MDEFAQSREDDDLFADEFEPISDPVAVVEEPKPSVNPPVQEPSTHSQPQVQPSNNNARREQGQDRRGRGGRGRGNNGNGLSSSRYATSPADVPALQNTSEAATSQDSQPTQSSAPSAQNGPAPHAENPATNRIPAVRGDRSATGGPAHKKLTEEELTAKMAKMAVINAEKAERHRLSEADQAAYQHREKELAKEKKEKAVAEKKNERVMEMERAKNRERKMKAQGGREWDSEKVESDIVDGRGRGRSSEYVRGGHGGVIRGGGGLAESRFSGPEDVAEPVASERGGHQNRGRGARGRGGRGKTSTSSRQVPSAEDFPSLPTPSKEPVTAKESISAIELKTEAIKSPTGEKGPHDWAEEMATPIEEKKSTI